MRMDDSGLNSMVLDEPDSEVDEPATDVKEAFNQLAKQLPVIFIRQAICVQMSLWKKLFLQYD